MLWVGCAKLGLGVGGERTRKRWGPGGSGGGSFSTQDQLQGEPRFVSFTSRQLVAPPHSYVIPKTRVRQSCVQIHRDFLSNRFCASICSFPFVLSSLYSFSSLLYFTSRFIHPSLSFTFLLLCFSIHSSTITSPFSSPCHSDFFFLLLSITFPSFLLSASLCLSLFVCLSLSLAVTTRKIRNYGSIAVNAIDFCTYERTMSMSRKKGQRIQTGSESVRCVSSTMIVTQRSEYARSFTETEI